MDKTEINQLSLPITITTSKKVKSFDGVEIDCKISMPEGFKALVILVHGSFNQDKDGNFDSNSLWMFPKELPKRNLFIDIGNQLLKLNLGVLRYDKRASGQSGGIYEDTDMDVLSSDLNALIDFAHHSFSKPVFVLGQSEGAQTAIYCQQQFNSAEGIILQGANFGDIDQLLNHQRERAAKVFIEGNSSTITYYPYLTALYQNMYKPDFLNLVKNSTESKAIVSVGEWSHLTNIKKYRQYGTIKIADVLKSILIPIEIIHGTEDANCNIDFLKNEQHKFINNQKVKINIIDGLDHSFRKATAHTPLVDSMRMPINEKYFEILSHSVSRLLKEVVG
ncbi:MAG: alpha/beta hydrolase [Pseudobdellovibrionaceae bacterium]